MEIAVALKPAKHLLPACDWARELAPCAVTRIVTVAVIRVGL